MISCRTLRGINESLCVLFFHVDSHGHSQILQSEHFFFWRSVKNSSVKVPMSSGGGSLNKYFTENSVSVWKIINLPWYGYNKCLIRKLHTSISLLRSWRSSPACFFFFCSILLKIYTENFSLLLLLTSVSHKNKHSIWHFNF